MHNRFRPRFGRFPMLVAMCAAVCVTELQARGEVESAEFVAKPATPFSYTIDGVEYTWGLGYNQLLEHFTVAGERYSHGASADHVTLSRNDIDGVSTGVPCGVFVQRNGYGVSPTQLEADYPASKDGSGNCDMVAMLSSRVMNRGTLDLFSNVGPTRKNVERADYVFQHGLLAPIASSALAQAGHVIGEKSGNNPVQMAAILALDDSHRPTAFGPLVMVQGNGCETGVCYGMSGVRHNYSFFHSSALEPQARPGYVKDSTEELGMAFVSAADLGLSAAQRYYGVAYFARDVDASIHDLLDPATFPDDSEDPFILGGDGADIYGGAAGRFLADALSVGRGAVFIDNNSDGLPGDGDAPVPGIAIQLIADSNDNGVLDDDDVVLAIIDSGRDGRFQIPGLPDGAYFVQLDEADDDLPPGLSLPSGQNPIIISINGNDADQLHFALINQSKPTDPLDDPDGEVSTTRAVEDTAEVNQGAEILIDVLANDIDGPGQGLSLVGTPSSPNATILVKEQHILYRPNPDFYGTDSFLYVMSDSEGTQGSGTVNVTVVRYSDINDNLLNDFEECGCETLGLEIGVHGFGVGGGALGWLTLLSLSGVALRRRLCGGA